MQFQNLDLLQHSILPKLLFNLSRHYNDVIFICCCFRKLVPLMMSTSDVHLKAIYGIELNNI